MLLVSLKKIMVQKFVFNIATLIRLKIYVFKLYRLQFIIYYGSCWK